MENTITIINGCRQGNHKYQKILYEQYRGTALKTVFRYIYNYEEAIEITNDGFVKFFLSIDKFKCEDRANVENVFTAWLRRIMINTAIDLLRKKMLLPEIGGIPDSLLDYQGTSSSDQMLIYKDLIKIIKSLPPSYRIVFNMFIIDGYSHLEIADILNIPVSTSRSNLLRSKVLIQKYLQKTETLIECRI